MSTKAKDLACAFAKGHVSRRDLLRGMSALGVSVAFADFLVNGATTEALAQGFDWKKNSGKRLNLLLNKHPYTDAMIADLDNFKSLTGMDVKYDVFPEDVYFDKVTAALSSRSSQYDVFMSGAYQTWQYGPAGWLADLKEFIENPSLTAPNYAFDDILPNLRAATAWSGVPGAALGGPGAKQWALPWGFELNSVSYNRRVFDQMKFDPPKNLQDLREKAARVSKDMAGQMYGIGVRGSRSWATIHPGYLSGFTNFGARDFAVNGGKLKASMNSPEGKAFTREWVAMIQEAGPKNWSTYTWYEVGNDLSAGASAMIYDADILGYFMNGTGKEKGHIAFTAFTPNPKAAAPTPNVWIWSLAMSNFSHQKEAAWSFMQWASGTEHGLFGAQKMDFVNPVRKTVWNDETFRKRIADHYPGYLEQYEASAPGAKIYFTPQPLFFNLTTDWAAALQKMVAKEVPVDEGLDQLAQNIDAQLKRAGI